LGYVRMYYNALGYDMLCYYVWCKVMTCCDMIISCNVLCYFFV
jgi:hypothetical protein